jgi:hypothetical protein
MSIPHFHENITIITGASRSIGRALAGAGSPHDFNRQPVLELLRQIGERYSKTPGQCRSA